MGCFGFFFFLEMNISTPELILQRVKCFLGDSQCQHFNSWRGFHNISLQILSMKCLLNEFSKGLFIKFCSVYASTGWGIICIDRAMNQLYRQACLNVRVTFPPLNFNHVTKASTSLHRCPRGWSLCKAEIQICNLSFIYRHPKKWSDLSCTKDLPVPF